MVKKKRKKIKKVKEFSWYQATILSLVFGLVSFFIFLFLEIIFGDILKDILDAEYQAEMYFNINIILYLGLFFIFISSFIVNVFALRKYAFEPKFISNLFVLVFTGITLFFISWISIVIVYDELYNKLTIIGQIQLAPNFYSLFSIYILPNPVYFWILGFVIYHLFLIIFIKLFFIEKPNISKKSD
ncbi:hypothetical protein LCGC14_0931840 [marine sediment metagenome]|uniref:Uncharacterized protein n=1 Tax=marine sediment metagenome TaxID=412755 RepID=A0A0F9R686_9ZZZZ|nr:MAG: hypothetical protein Lokiarch_21410 [Candidatus Lokiarchaeum sp. GC14_75]